MNAILNTISHLPNYVNKQEYQALKILQMLKVIVFYICFSILKTL